MATYLMCRDKPIYNITKGQELNRELLPALPFNYTKWRSNRAYLKTNRAVESTIKKAGGIDSKISRRRLSLSDCYWVMYSYDTNTSFDSITPYHNEFVMAYLQSGATSSGAPDITLGGSYPKAWERYNNTTVIRKGGFTEQARVEFNALALAHLLGLNTCKAHILNIANKQVLHTTTTTKYIDLDTLGAEIFIYNATDIDNMLIPLNTAIGTLRLKTRLTVKEAVILLSGFIPLREAIQYVLTTYLFDSVVGNDDREYNLSNWAYIKNSATGITTPAFLYDFNLSNNGSFSIIKHLAGIDKEFRESAKTILTKWEPTITAFSHTEWQDNLKYLIQHL